MPNSHAGEFMAVAAIALTGLIQRPAFSEGTLTPLPIRRRGIKLPAVGNSVASTSWQKRRGRRRKVSPKRNQKSIDTEFDLVIVPADGISMSGSESDVSDWSVGWFEPHHNSFTTENELEDSFAVLVPCYGSPSPNMASAGKSPFKAEEQPPWAAALANLSKRSNEGKHSFLRLSACATLHHDPKIQYLSSMCNVCNVRSTS